MDRLRPTIVLADDSSAHQPCPGPASVGYNLAGGGLDAGDVVNSLTIGQELRSGKHSLTDYNFTTSNADLKASETTIYTVASNDTMEIFDYPGVYATGSDGTAVVKLRMQEEEAVHKIGRGTGVCRPFTTGYKFELKDHPLEAMNASYVLTEIQHVATVAGTYRDDAAGTGHRCGPRRVSHSLRDDANRAGKIRRSGERAAECVGDQREQP